MKSSLIALDSNLLVNLNICKAIRWITTFGNGNMLSSLNKGSVCAKYGENVIILRTQNSELRILFNIIHVKNYTFIPIQLYYLIL